MQWIHSINRGRRFHNGLAAWTSAGSPRSASWRWPSRPFDGLLTKPCPLGEFCTARKDRRWSEERAMLEPSAESAGRVDWFGLEEEGEL